MDKDIAGLVERLDSLIVDDPPGGNGFRVDPAIEVRDVVNAASTIRAQAAEIELLRGDFNDCYADLGDVTIKLCEAVAENEGLQKKLQSTAMEALSAQGQAWDNHDRAEAAEAKLREAVEVMRPFAGSSVTFSDFSRAHAFLTTMEKQEDSTSE